MRIVPPRAAALVLLALVSLTPPAAQAAEKNLPVPRFVALRSDDVNVRTGPGERYPIEWVYKRKDLPVEIVEEFEHWRKIRDFEGSVGWVHQRMLVGRRSVLVQQKVAELHRRAQPESDIVARLAPGVVARLYECQGAWCRVEAQSAAQTVGGWLRRNEVWGVYPDETVQ